MTAQPTGGSSRPTAKTALTIASTRETGPGAAIATAIRKPAPTHAAIGCATFISSSAASAPSGSPRRRAPGCRRRPRPPGRRGRGHQQHVPAPSTGISRTRRRVPAAAEPGGQRSRPRRSRAARRRRAGRAAGWAESRPSAVGGLGRRCPRRTSGRRRATAAPTKAASAPTPGDGGERGAGRRVPGGVSSIVVVVMVGALLVRSRRSRRLGSTLARPRPPASSAARPNRRPDPGRRGWAVRPMAGHPSGRPRRRCPRSYAPRHVRHPGEVAGAARVGPRRCAGRSC